MPHPLAHVDGAVEVPTYEAPVPTILNEETTTQIYNLCKCKVTVIANSNVMQIFKLNNSGMSFMDKGKFIYETKITWLDSLSDKDKLSDKASFVFLLEKHTIVDCGFYNNLLLLYGWFTHTYWCVYNV